MALCPQRSVVWPAAHSEVTDHFPPSLQSAAALLSPRGPWASRARPRRSEPAPRSWLSEWVCKDHRGALGPDRAAPLSAGLCALSINNDNCYLAYPGSATIGEVQVFDTINLVRPLEAPGGARP